MTARTAVVTGASRGIGREVAVDLAGRGYRLALLARDGGALAAVAAAAGGDPAPLVEPVDVTDPDALDVSLARCLAAFGGRLDLLVNNAGSALERKRLEDLTDEDWQAGLDLNLLAAARAGRACFAALKEAGGCIVNVSSAVAGRASVTGGPYVAAKAALEGLTRVTALEWARHGIRCVAVAPGYVATNFNAPMVEAGTVERFLAKVPTRTAIDPAEVARLVGDLADPAHRSLTGAVVAVDGGLTVGI